MLTESSSDEATKALAGAKRVKELLVGATMTVSRQTVIFLAICSILQQFGRFQHNFMASFEIWRNSDIPKFQVL